MNTLSLDNFGFSKTSNENVYQKYMIGKNLLSIGITGTASGTNINGVTFTINSNGSVTANGLNNGTRSTFRCVGSTDFINVPFPVKVTGLPSGASENTYWFGGANVGYLDHNGHVFSANLNLTLSIEIAPNYNCDNLVFWPMITPSYEDDTYSPYVKNLQDLTKIANKSSFEYNDFLIPKYLRWIAFDIRLNDYHQIIIKALQRYADSTLIMIGRYASYIFHWRVDNDCNIYQHGLTKLTDSTGQSLKLVYDEEIPDTLILENYVNWDSYMCFGDFDPDKYQVTIVNKPTT